jgi:Flp pilus assembly protein TadD
MMTPLAPAIRIALVMLCLAPAPGRANEAAEIRDLLARGQATAALPRAAKAAADNPRDAQARFLHGVVLMDLQRDDEALSLFTRLAQDYPELPDPQNNIALLQARAGRLDLARQALEAALRNDPTHRLARTNLGHLHLMLAAQAWEQAAATGPLDPSLLRRLEGVRALLAGSSAPAR